MPMPSPAGTYDELQAEIGRSYPALSRQLQRIARFALAKVPTRGLVLG